jgi:hypothetical protein
MLATRISSTKGAHVTAPIRRALIALAARGRAAVRKARIARPERQAQAALAEWDGRAAAKSVSERLDRIKRESWLHLQMRTGFHG